MKIAFCKFAGLANGGTEKYLQAIAIIFKKHGHDIDYYYTNAATILNSNWKHPDNDKNREELLKSNGINLIPIHVEFRKHNSWINSNFFEKFNENNYEYLITAGNGEPEFPYMELNNIKIIHTVHGDHVFNKSNIIKSVLLCNWQANRWRQNSGDSTKLEIIPSIVYTPQTYIKEFRKKYNIPENAFVYGLHQRNDVNISSTISLQAFSKMKNDNIYCVILGYTSVHKNYVNSNNIKNVILLDCTSDINEMHEFLDGIDVYAHCRVDGEVCSAAIIEAMYHKKPIISYPGQNMGHVEQLENCGKMCYSVDEYLKEMINLKEDKNYYNEMSNKIDIKYKTTYDYNIVENKILELIKNI